MPLLTPLRAVVNFSAARQASKHNAIRFKGQLVDEVGKENKKKMSLIDEFARTEKLTDKQQYDYRDYQRDYRELNEDLQYGVEKKEVTGLMQLSIAQMWQKIPDKYKQMFEQFQQSQGIKSSVPRQYSSSRLSQVHSSQPEAIVEEAEE